MEYLTEAQKETALKKYLYRQKYYNYTKKTTRRNMLNHPEGILKTFEMMKRRKKNTRERNKSNTKEKEKRDTKEKNKRRE